jgi:hypothetical protein
MCLNSRVRSIEAVQAIRSLEGSAMSHLHDAELDCHANLGQRLWHGAPEELGPGDAESVLDAAKLSSESRVCDDS